MEDDTVSMVNELLLYENEKERSGRTMKIWQAALYVRLSREDGDKAESDSIGNQKELLHQFVELESDISVFDVYVDDGWSGTNFERPEFKRMIDDIKAKKIDCVIVKDLSRFGRNYIEVGQYIEKIFPLMDIRFISITDRLDSYKNPQSMNNIIVPFKNLINDEYCRDISNKVRSSLDMKRKQGKHIGSFACYGYKKDPQDHNHLVIDEEAAYVVRDIYKWYISGISIISIVKKLNEMGVKNPSAYKKELGINYKNQNAKISDGKWGYSTVRKILSNQMYIGDLVQGVVKIKSYKVQVAQRVNQDDWIIVKGTHEAIISKEDFEIVQSLLKRRGRKAPQNNKLYALSGFVKCGDCGRSMSRKCYHHSYGEYAYYVCSTYVKIDKNACTKHSTRMDNLEKIVLSAIQSQIALAVDMEQAINEINMNENANREAVRLRKMLEKSRSDVQKAEDMLCDLYPDWKSGVITKNEYVKLKERFELQKQNALQKVMEYQDQIEKTEKGADSKNEFLDQFVKYQNIDKLTREVMVALIDTIYIYENKKVKIVFKYQNPYLEALEYIKNNKDILDKNKTEFLLGA